MENDRFSYKFQKNIYEGLTFFDQYGSSLIFFILISFILLILILFSYAYSNAATLKSNWNENRCKPYVIPFAGFIMQPKDMSIHDYTSMNFNYCMQENAKEVSGPALEPLSYITNSLSKLSGELAEGLNSARAMMDKMRENVGNIFKEIYQRLVNFLIPLQQIIIKTKDSFGKLQGVMVASVYTFLGAYFGLEAFLGSIAQLLVNILIAMAAAIMIMWITPFTWGAAAAGTALFVAISIPLGIFITFLREELGMEVKFGNLKVPKPKKLKCFDKNTKIKMHDGTEKEIVNIQPGDLLQNNDQVNAIFQVAAEGSVMYNIDGVIVSDTHLVFDSSNEKWVRAKNHSSASLVSDYKEPYLYCLNTQSGSICIHNILFSDWNEFSAKKIRKAYENVQPTTSKNWMHKSYENGLHADTKVIKEDGSIVEMREIKVGDVLQGGSVVYGVVKINGTDTDQYDYTRNSIDKFQGSSNICFCSNKTYHIESTLDCFSLSKEKVCESKREKTLYNILTSSNWFPSKHCVFGDYNMAMDCM